MSDKEITARLIVTVAALMAGVVLLNQIPLGLAPGSLTGPVTIVGGSILVILQWGWNSSNQARRQADPEFAYREDHPPLMEQILAVAIVMIALVLFVSVVGGREADQLNSRNPNPATYQPESWECDIQHVKHSVQNYPVDPLYQRCFDR